MAKKEQYMRALGVDCGGTGSRWLLVNAQNNEVASGELAAISGNSFSNEDFPTEWKALLTNLKNVLPEDPNCIAIASTGIHQGSIAVKRLQNAIAQTFELPTTKIKVESDMPVAYRSILEPGEGLMVYAGTGALVHHIDKDGISHQVGGYGEYIDDAGGGFWIGQLGLRHALRFQDAGKLTVLSQTIFEDLNAKNWPDVWQYVYASDQPRGAIAHITKSVAEAAYKGDQYAIAILEKAGWELAQQTLLLMTKIDVNKVGLMGGALNIDIVRRSLIANLPDHLEIKIDAIKPVEAAAKWALELFS